jgi:hypothetical protein
MRGPGESYSVAKLMAQHGNPLRSPSARVGVAEPMIAADPDTVAPERQNLDHLDAARKRSLVPVEGLEPPPTAYITAALTN